MVQFIHNGPEVSIVFPACNRPEHVQKTLQQIPSTDCNGVRKPDGVGPGTSDRW